jgi:hypothetical protein
VAVPPAVGGAGVAMDSTMAATSIPTTSGHAADPVEQAPGVPSPVALGRTSRDVNGCHDAPARSRGSPGELRSVKSGGSRRISATALREYVDRLEAEEAA